jgi:flagellar motor switch protein FliG
MAESDLRKAAVLLMSLPERQAAGLLGKLPPEQAAAVLAAVSGIEQVGRDEQEAAIRDLSEALPSCSGGGECRRRRSGMTGLVKILNAMHPPYERRLLGEIGQAAPDLLDEIRQAIFGADVAAISQFETLDAA